MSKLKQKIINNIIEVEGGFVDHVDDSGGKTRFGITKAVARSWGYTGSMKRLPRELAFDIYAVMYWGKLGLDYVEALSASITAEMADTAVNMGVGTAGGFLQRSLNVLNRRARDFEDLIVDGLVGRRTLGALRSYLNKRGKDGETVLLRMLNALQGARYIDLAERFEKNETFQHGWFLHRVKMT